MTFLTLEERFNNRRNVIYSFGEQTADTANVSEPFVNIKLSTVDRKGVFTVNNNIKNDSRLLPLESLQRDLLRITSFSRSPKGILFLGKQVLLQTGNTFAETRLYNPVNVILNSRPAVRLGGISTRFSRFVSIGPLNNNRGALQKETLSKFNPSILNKLRGVPLLGTVTNTIESGVRATLSPFTAIFTIPKLTKYFDDESKEYYIRPEDKIFYTKTRGSDVVSGPVLYRTQPIELRKAVSQFYAKTVRNTFYGSLNRYLSQSLSPFKINENDNRYKTRPEYSFSYKKLEEQTNVYYETKVKGKIRDSYNYVPNFSKFTKGVLYASDVLLRYNQIPYSVLLDSSIIDKTKFTNTSSFYEAKPDIIKFSFETKNEEPIHFRALISDIKQTTKPEFSEQRYIGRPERFVMYAGGKRSISLRFNIVAMSQEEIDIMWTRINYLTGLAFPAKVQTGGFFTPPLFNITIGDIYNSQPCYIDSLEYDFLDESITFDIDNQVSQVINVSMTLNILEKRSKYFNSPFYNIVEKTQKISITKTERDDVMSQMRDSQRSEVVRSRDISPYIYTP